MPYLPALVYERLIDPLLKSNKRRIRTWIRRERSTGPVLDLCSGTGAQAHLLSDGGISTITLDLNYKLLQHVQSKRFSGTSVCADAIHLPIRDDSLPIVNVSYALHDKSAIERGRLLSECRRVLKPSGKLILLDFDRPWHRISRLAWWFTTLVECFAGWRHFLNGREFLRTGGLEGLMERNGMTVLRRHPIPWGHSSLVMTTCEDQERTESAGT
jgi:ubiquinone/menaquinone biosynthesis C-methylase UbiE